MSPTPELIELSDAGFARLREILANPPEPSQRLIDAAKRVLCVADPRCQCATCTATAASNE